MDTVPETLRAALAGRYTLERMLGRGGMATVYLAHDPRHRRPLAVKVFREDVTATIGAERFLREIEIAAQLQHPNILTLIDSGQADGFLYYVMPYVAGDSLRRLLDASGVIEPPLMVALVSEVADALDYAHRRGVVHRDIKPENILISEGHAVVADFGIARAVTSAAGGRITRTGVPIGTPGYMSPEQAAGLVQLDPRTDVFSLAAVTYEMAVGEPPGRWLTEEAVRLGKFLDAPDDHRRRLDRLPGGAEHALVKALAVIETQRFGGALEFARALASSFDDRPRFREPEVRAIVGRAAEIQAAADLTAPPEHSSGADVTSAPDLRSGITIGGVERLAAEVGIPPEDVRQAARELGRRHRTGSGQKYSIVAGGTTASTLERTVPGEVNPAVYHELVQELAVTMGEQGLASALGRDLRWRMVTSGGLPRDVTVTVRPSEGETKIRIEEKNDDIREGYGLGFIGAAGVMGTVIWAGVSAGPLQSAVAFVVGASVWLSSCVFAARRGFRWHRKGREAEHADLADALADHISRTLAGRTTPNAGVTPPRIRPVQTPS